MPMVIGFAVCGVAAFVLTQLTIRGDSPPVEGPLEVPAE